MGHQHDWMWIRAVFCKHIWNSSHEIIWSSHFTLLRLIFSHIPPRGASMNDFVSIARGMGVFSLTLISYLDSRDTSPTLVCISPKRIPEMVKLTQLDFSQVTKIVRVLVILNYSRACYNDITIYWVNGRIVELEFVTKRLWSNWTWGDSWLFYWFFIYRAVLTLFLIKCRPFIGNNSRP